MNLRYAFGSVAMLLLASACGSRNLQPGELLRGGSGSTPDGAAGQSGGSSAQGGNSDVGRAVSLDYEAIDVAVGTYHACALMSDGRAYCWGSNSAGQLGDGSDAQGSWDRPVQVVALPETAQHIQAEYERSCAQLSDGTLRCWGENFYGQLGNGVVYSQEFTPVQSLGYPVQQVALGEYHSCALLFDGSVQCWGDGEAAPLGDGAMAFSIHPVAVVGVSSSLQVELGSAFACALIADGTVSCWGDYPFCGTERHRNAVTVPGLTDVVQISVASGFGCAVHSDGQVSCWGADYGTNLGVPTSEVEACPWRAPARVAGLDHVVEVSTGSTHACALRDNGEVYCWGSNRGGQLGDGTFRDHAEATRVPGISATKLSAGLFATCALLSDKHISCWGALQRDQVNAQTVPNLIKF